MTAKASIEPDVPRSVAIFVEMQEKFIAQSPAVLPMFERFEPIAQCRRQGLCRSPEPDDGLRTSPSQTQNNIRQQAAVMKELSVSELGKRILQLIVSLFILLCVTFVIGRVLPADPVGAIVGELADPATLAAMRSKAWPRPAALPAVLHLSDRLLHGDFGNAILTGNPVPRT
jgi:hypothetical protein